MSFEVADVNGDGKADLVWRNTSSGEVVIWLMNGAMIASSGYLGGVSQAWKIAVTGNSRIAGTTEWITMVVFCRQPDHICFDAITQGDMWDAQKDIAYAVVGSILGLLLHLLWGSKITKEVAGK